LLLSSEEPLSERDLAGASSGGVAAGSDEAGDRGTAPKERTTPPPAATGEKPATSSEPAAPTAPTAPVAPTAPTQPDSPSDEPGPPRRWHVLLIAPMGALSVGPLRRTSHGLAVAAGVSFDSWHFLADAKLWARRSQSLQSQRTRLSRFWDWFRVGALRASVGASSLGERKWAEPRVACRCGYLGCGRRRNASPCADRALAWSRRRGGC